jgi:exodeoxyribonuclease III
MLLASWNVNGIRASFNKDVFKHVFELGADIICIQETKAQESQLTESQRNYFGYTSVFESARNRKGYSGVAVYSRIPFTLVHATLGNKNFYDEEGRTLVVECEHFYLINCYFPNGGKSQEHFEYKLKYYTEFLSLAQKLEKKKPVIFCGDINATRADVDLARPKENKGKVGCTDVERDALKKFADSFIDTYRYIHGERVQYTWWDQKSRARDGNVGWRIDYFFTSKVLEKKIKNAEIRDDIYGSDHCPVTLEMVL